MNRNDTPVTATASSDSDEAKDQLQSSQEPRVGHSFSTDLTTPPPQPTEAEDELRKILDVKPFMKTRRMEQVLSWHLTQLQALKQALPEKARERRTMGKDYAGYSRGHNAVLKEVERLIDTHIARIGGEK